MAKPPPPVRTAKPPQRPGSIPDRPSIPERQGSIPDATSVVERQGSVPDLDSGPPRAPLRSRTAAGDDRPGSIPDLDVSVQVAQKNLADDLAQVEAAMAALEGRDPTRGIEVAHARRDAERVRVELKSLVDQGEIRVTKNEKRRKWLVVAGALAVLGLAGGAVKTALLISESAAETAAMEAEGLEAARPFTAIGFAHHVSSLSKPLTIMERSGRCFVAVAATRGGPASVRVERGADKIEGASAAWCSCGEVPVTATGLGTGPVVLEVVAIDAGAVGGPDHLGDLRPKPEVMLAESDDRGCAEAAIDELVAGSKPAPPASDLAADRLVASGFRPLASAAADARFLEIVGGDDTCVVVKGDGKTADLSLRLSGGARPLGPDAKAIAICETKGSAPSVWRRGKGRLDAFAAPIARIGGYVGLHEALGRAGLAGTPIHRTEAVVATEARAQIFASGASPAHLMAGGTSLLGSADPPYLFSFAASDGRSAPSLTGDDVRCTPALTDMPPGAVCLGGRALKDDSRGVGASRPEWLRIGADAAAVEAGLLLLSLARRLHASGFVPTPPAGAAVNAAVADIVGRPNESAFVGVIIGDQAPFIHTLSEAGPWTVQGEPRVIAIGPGARVAVVATPKVPPGGKPSIVLFRR